MCCACRVKSYVDWTMPNQHGSVLVKGKRELHETATIKRITSTQRETIYNAYENMRSVRTMDIGESVDADTTNKYLISDTNLTKNKITMKNNLNEDTAGQQLLLTRESMRVMILTESFHPYTSGIARRFKEIIQRLAKRGFLIHVVTGCKGCETWANELNLGGNVTFSSLRAIEFKDKIDCALPFLLPQVSSFQFHQTSGFF